MWKLSWIIKLKSLEEFDCKENPWKLIGRRKLCPSHLNFFLHKLINHRNDTDSLGISSAKNKQLSIVEEAKNDNAKIENWWGKCVPKER